MRGLDVFVLVVLFLTLGLGIYILIQSLPGKTIEFEPKNNPLAVNSSEVYVNSAQFYPNMRYPDSNITYQISKFCSDKKKAYIRLAFGILESNTILNFNEVDDNGQINVLCANINSDSGDSTHFVAGEGGPVDVYLSGSYYVITSGKISLYRDEKCDKPQIALHEILHALGFDHNGNPKSIMYPITSCDEELDQYIIDDINSIYSVRSAADLKIVNASATKSGKYLEFVAQVSNQGLKDAKEVTLHLYSDNGEIKSIPLGRIPMGSSKKITGEYVSVPKELTSVRMTVTIGAGESEISLSNNEISLDIVPA